MNTRYRGRIIDICNRGQNIGGPYIKTSDRVSKKEKTLVADIHPVELEQDWRIRELGNKLLFTKSIFFIIDDYEMVVFVDGKYTSTVVGNTKSRMIHAVEAVLKAYL